MRNLALLAAAVLLIAPLAISAADMDVDIARDRSAHKLAPKKFAFMDQTRINDSSCRHYKGV